MTVLDHPHIDQPNSSAPQSKAKPTEPIAIRWSTVVLQNGGLFIAWGLLTVVFSLLSPDVFASIDNFRALFSTQSVMLVLAIGFLPPLVCGDLDLTPPATAGVVMVVTATLNTNHGWPIIGAIALGVGLGLAVGVVNSILVVLLGVDSIVATLGMSTLLGGVALGIGALPIPVRSHALVTVMTHPIIGFQTAFFLALGVCTVAWFVLSHMPTGRRIFFVGAGRSTARLSGIAVARLRATALMTSSLIAALAGVMMLGLFGSATATTAPPLLLPALASVFLGATAVTPGRFNVWGTFGAVYFLVFGIAGLETQGISGWVSQVFYGGSLIVAVVLSRLGRLRHATS